MKRPLVALIMILALLFAAGAQTPPQAKPEDVLKNLVRIDKVEAPPDDIRAGFESIAARDSIAMLTYLSSDLMEGRETATRGYQLAAEYAASLLALWKVKPAGDAPGRSLGGRRAPMAEGAGAPAEKSYLQEFAVKEITDSSQQISLEVRKGDAVRSRPFVAGVDYTGMSSTAETLTAPVVFAGYGISEKAANWDDFKGLDIKGKIVLVISEAPGKDNPESPFQKIKELKDKYFPQTPAMMRMGGGFNKGQEIAKLGAAAVLQVQNSGKDADAFRNMTPSRRVNDDRPVSNRPRRRLLLPGTSGTMPWERSPVINVTREMADAILENAGQKFDDLQKKIESTGKPASMLLPGTSLTIATTVKAQLVRAANVLGFVEGSDPALKNEVVVVGAHLDHLGKSDDYIWNGADDNGSGSVGVLNVARAMAVNGRKPRRTVVFALWTGEEQGLLGSRHFVRNPPIAGAKTVAYINMDMISRPYDERTVLAMGRMFNFPGGQDFLKLIKPANFLPVSFTAGGGWAEALRAADRLVGLDVFLRESTGEGRGGGRSDHSSFASEKIPWLFPIAAMTEDYHQTSDSVEKASGELIEKVSRLLYVTAFTVADK